jgi:ribosome biogenesis protein ERB1
LIPKLPSPKDLQPFPSSLAITYKGHTGRVRSISVDPTGLWLASASEDNTLRIWEVNTGYCVKKWTFESSVNYVSWNPNKNISVLVVASGKFIYILTCDVFGELIEQSTVAFVDSIWASGRKLINTIDVGSNKHCSWTKPSAAERSNGYLVKLELKQVR